MNSQVYFVVDDQKGGEETKPDNQQMILVRSFDAIPGEEFQRLIRNLDKAKAHEWHASARGLPQSEDFLKIIRNVNRCDSKLYYYSRLEKQASNHEFSENIALFRRLSENTNWYKHWPLERSVQARILAWTIITTMFAHWRGAPQRMEGPPKMLTFIVDRMDFFDEKSIDRELAKGHPLPKGCFCAIGFTTRLGFDVRVIALKSKKVAAPIMKALVGIVDGEAWLWNKFTTFPAPNNSSIKQAGIDYSYVEGDDAKEAFEFPLQATIGALEKSTFTTSANKNLVDELFSTLAFGTSGTSPDVLQ